MARSGDILDGANALVCIVATATADGVVPGLGSAVGGAASLNNLRRLVGREQPNLCARIADALDAALTNPHQPLPTDGRVLIPQMILAASPAPSDMMAARMDAGALCDLLLARMTDREHLLPDMQAAFRRVVAPILHGMLADPSLTTALQPAFMRAVAETMGAVGEGVEDLKAGQAQLQAMMLQLLDRTGESQAAIDAGVTRARLIALARQVASDVSDPDQAFRELEAVIAEAIESRARLALTSNADGVVSDLRRRLAPLLDAGRLQEAADAAMQTLTRLQQEEADRRAQASAAQAEVIDIAVARFRELRNAETIAQLLVQQAEAEGKAGFNDLRALQDVWYERGRDAGLNFDLSVSIALARITLSRARGPDQRGAAGNDLATVLAVLGEREPGTARLEQAVASYTAALQEWTRDRVPLQWATTQMNLGNALATLGQRESGTARLEQAVAAYEAALQERTRDRVPLDWAVLQFNLAGVEIAYFNKTADTAHLDRAGAHGRAALDLFTQAGASQYVAQAEQRLAEIAALRP